MVFLRHGYAEDTKPDFDRKLVPSKKFLLKHSGIFLSRFPFNEVIISPSLRTIETFEEIRHLIQFKTFRIEPKLYQDEVLKEELKSTLLISHAPQILKSVFEITSQQIDLEPADIAFLDGQKFKVFSKGSIKTF